MFVSFSISKRTLLEALDLDLTGVRIRVCATWGGCCLDFLMQSRGRTVRRQGDVAE